MNVTINGVLQNYRVTQAVDADFVVNTKPILSPLGKHAERKIALELGGESGKSVTARAPLSSVQNYLQDPVPSTIKWNEETHNKFNCIRKNDILLKLRCSALALQEGITSRGTTRKIVFKDFSEMPNELRIVLSSEGKVDIVKLHREHMQELVANMGA